MSVCSKMHLNIKIYAFNLLYASWQLKSSATDKTRVQNEINNLIYCIKNAGPQFLGSAQKKGFWAGFLDQPWPLRSLFLS